MSPKAKLFSPDVRLSLKMDQIQFGKEEEEGEGKR